MCVLGIVAALALGSPFVVSLSVNETARQLFGGSWAKAHAAGLRATTLSLDWNRIETAPGTYDLTLPKIADAFYPTQSTAVGLVLRELNTNRDERPEDLRDRPFDDPALLTRWKGMATAVLDAMPHTPLSWIGVGNEVDASLTPGSPKAEAYVRFLKAAVAFLHTKRPGVPVGTPLTFDGIKRSPTAWQKVAATGDVTMVNYYLLGAAKLEVAPTVRRDLATMRRFAGSRRLLLTEAGCPSGRGAGGSEVAQADFFRTLLADAPSRGVPYVNLVWMVDVGTSSASEIAGMYGSQAADFRDFLATLGLMREDGTAKPAWDVVAAKLRAR